MSRLRRGALRAAGVGLLLALLAVPVALSGHHHDAQQAGASDACSLCASVGHAAAAALPLLPQIVPIEHAVAHHQSSEHGTARIDCDTQAARGPPRPATLVVA